MTFAVRIRPRAQDDIRDARDWYEKQAAGLGAEFGLELGAVFSRLAENPMMHAAVYRGTDAHSRGAFRMRFTT